MIQPGYVTLDFLNRLPNIVPREEPVPDVSAVPRQKPVLDVSAVPVVSNRPVGDTPITFWCPRRTCASLVGTLLVVVELVGRPEPKQCDGSLILSRQTSTLCFSAHDFELSLAVERLEHAQRI